MAAAATYTELARLLPRGPRSLQQHEEGSSNKWRYPQDLDGKSDAWQAFCNSGNSILGYGLLQMPLALKNAGLVPGIVTSLIMASLSAYVTQLMTTVAHAHGISNYEMLCAKALGSSGSGWGLVGLAGFQFLYSMFALTTFARGLYDCLAPAICTLATHATGEAPWYCNQGAVFAIVAIVVLLPLCLIPRHISSLWLVSLAACLSPVVVVVLMGASIETFQVHGDRLQIGFGHHFAQAFGTISVAFLCQHLSFQVYNSMKDKEKFKPVLIGSMTASLITLLSLAVLGYCTFRSDTLDDILDNYTGAKPTPSLSDRVPMLVGQLVMCVNLVGSFPLNVSLARHSVKMVVDWWLEARSFDQWGRPVHDLRMRDRWLEAVVANIRSPDAVYSKWMHVGVTLVLWLVVCTAGPFLTNELSIIIQAFGAFGLAGLGFILPALCCLLLGDAPASGGDSLDLRRSWHAIAVLVVGLASLVMAIIAAVNAGHS